MGLASRQIPSSCCVTSGKSLNLSVPRCLHLQNVEPCRCSINIYPFICIKEIGHQLVINLALVLFNIGHYQFLLRRISRPPKNPQGSNRMQVVKTKSSWPFRVLEGELKEGLLGISPSRPLGSGLYMWDCLDEIPEVLLWEIREHGQGLWSLTVIISVRASGMGVEFDAEENNFSLAQGRHDESCLQYQKSHLWKKAKT